MARGGWRRQPRDARGRFASYGYAGQTGGRGARLTSAGNKRDGGGAKMQAARPAGTIKKPAGLKPGSIKPKAQSIDSLNAARRKSNANEQKLREAYFKTQYGSPAQASARKALLAAEKKSQAATNKWRDAKAAANSYVARGDLAVTNIKMSGRRGKALDAEITRNVNAQKAASRAAAKTKNRQFKSDQSRAKKLRNVHGATLAKSYAAKSGQSPREVMNAIKGMAPSKQIKLFQKYVKENRK